MAIGGSASGVVSLPLSALAHVGPLPPPSEPDNPDTPDRAAARSQSFLIFQRGGGSHPKLACGVSGLSGKSEVRCGLGRGGRCCPVRSLSGLVRDGRRLMPGWRRPIGSSARDGCASRALRPGARKGTRVQRQWNTLSRVPRGD